MYTLVGRIAPPVSCDACLCGAVRYGIRLYLFPPSESVSQIRSPHPRTNRHETRGGGEIKQQHQQTPTNKQQQPTNTRQTGETRGEAPWSKKDRSADLMVRVQANVSPVPSRNKQARKHAARNNEQLRDRIGYVCHRCVYYVIWCMYI